MRAGIAFTDDLLSEGYRLDASYHASPGRHSTKQLSLSGRKLERLDQVCLPDGVFIPGRFKRIFVDDLHHGAPYVSGSSILQADPLMGAKLLSYRYTANMDRLSLREKMILITCSGEIGNTIYVNGIFKGAVGSPDLIRVLADPKKIHSGYLFAYLSSPQARALIQQKTYGAVIPHIEAHHVVDLPIPRLDPSQEEEIHRLIEQAAELRVEADLRLKHTQDRFYRMVLGIDPSDIKWRCSNEHAFAIGTTRFNDVDHRLDGFHHVGFVSEAERYLGKTIEMGELVDPYQPPMFKRPYTDEQGIPFLSGIDLYDYYPKPHMYISKKLPGIDSYKVAAGTILVQRVGQRYGLFGRPTILPKHLDQSAVTEHLFRLYPKNVRDRGYIFIWLSTEIGRRLLLKGSFGTSMGVLANDSFRKMPAPDCLPELRHSFEDDVLTICTLREQANDMEDQAQVMLSTSLGMTNSPMRLIRA